MQVGWIDGGVLIVPQSTHRPPRRPSISSAPRTNIALSGGTPIGTVSPAATSWPRVRSVSLYEIGDPSVSASITSAAPATGVSTSTRTPVVRPPPDADERDDPGRVECADRAEQRRGRAGVADCRVDRGRRGRAAADELGDGRAEATVRIGKGPGPDVERRERGSRLRRPPGGRSPRGRADRRRGRGRCPRRRRGSDRGTGGCA